MLIYVLPFLALLLCGASISNGSVTDSGATSRPTLRGTLTGDIGAGSADVAVSTTSADFFLISMTYQKSMMDSSPSPTRISETPPSKRMSEITETQLMQKESTPPLLTAEEKGETTSDPIDYSVSNTSTPSTTVAPTYSTMIGTMTSSLNITASTSSTTTSMISSPLFTAATKSLTMSVTMTSPSAIATPISLTMAGTVPSPLTTMAPTFSTMNGTVSYPSTKTALTSINNITEMTEPAPFSITNPTTIPSTAPMSTELVTIRPRDITGTSISSSVMPWTSPTLKNYTRISMKADTSTAASAMETKEAQTSAFTPVRGKYTKPPQNITSNYKGRIMLRVTLQISPKISFAVAMRELLKKICLLLAQNISAKELTASREHDKMFLPCANTLLPTSVPP